jgi:phosphoheptose isomerase
MSAIIDSYHNYARDLYIAMNTASIDVKAAYNVLTLSLGSPLYIFGNGGSAAIADHFCCDYNKGIYYDTGLKTKAISLSSNGPLNSAISNDFSYSQLFSRQLDFFGDGSFATAIAVSSSGNSLNITEGLKEAKKRNMSTMAFVGFDGGQVLRDKLADCIVHVKSNNYGIVEDAHMGIFHSLIQMIRTDYSLNPETLKL